MCKSLGVKYYEVIHKHLKRLHLQVIKDKVNKHRHIEVGRFLRYQLADSNASTRIVVHQRFVTWQAMPISRRRATYVMQLWSVVDSLLE